MNHIMYYVLSRNQRDQAVLAVVQLDCGNALKMEL
jgi:hypothetical protein